MLYIEGGMFEVEVVEGSEFAEIIKILEIKIKII